jgi:hypothetical protein
MSSRLDWQDGEAAGAVVCDFRMREAALRQVAGRQADTAAATGNRVALEEAGLRVRLNRGPAALLVVPLTCERAVRAQVLSVLIKESPM